MNLLQKMELDFKAEVVATQLLAYEQDLSKIIIDRLGNIPRTHTKDVSEIHEDISQFDLDSYTILKSFRQSIYEAIPENVFHPPTLGGLGKSQEEILDEIKNQRKKETEARTFFKPFEQEAPYLEMQALMMELMYEKKGTHDNLYRLFEQGWPVIKKLPHDMALSFIYILPILNEVRGKRDWIAKCLSFLTGFIVRIDEVFKPLKIESKERSFTMGKDVLGLTTTFSGDQQDGLPEWLLTVGPVPSSMAASVLPQSGFLDLLNTLLEYMAPANISITKKINVGVEAATMLTGEEGSGRLGYTFTL